MWFLEIITLVLTAVVCVLGLSTFPIPESYLPLAVLALLVLSLFYKKTWQLFVSKHYIYIYIFLLFYFFSLLIARGTNPAIGFTVNFILSLVPLVLFDLFSQRSKFFIATIIVVTTSVLFVDAWTGFEMIEFLGDKGLKASAHQEDANAFLRNSFAMVYSFVIIVPGLMAVLKHQKNISRFFIIRIVLSSLILAVSLVFIVLILRASYTTAVVVLVFSILFVFSPKRRNTIVVALFSIFLVVVLFLVYYQELLNIIQLDDSMDRMLSPRLEEMHDFLTGKANQAEDMNSRQDLTFSSVITFLKNPIFGVTWESTSFEYEEVVLGVGHHSEWFDLMARFGLFGLIPIMATYRTLKKHYKLSGQIVYIVVYVMLGFLNPIYNFFINFITFCYIPLIHNFFGINDYKPRKNNYVKCNYSDI